MKRQQGPTQGCVGFCIRPGLVAVFAPDAKGDIVPTHVINGSAKSFGFPIGIAIQP
jgi:hypothetical protein